MKDKELKVPSLPKPPQFKAWRNSVRTKVAERHPKKAKEVLGWILEVEDRDASIDSLEDIGAFLEVDVVLSSALTAVATCDLGREMNRFVGDRARDGRLARGRQLLWVIHDWNRVSGECGSYCDLEDLMSVERLGDNKIEQFRANWANVLSGCATAIGVRRSTSTPPSQQG